MPVTNPAQEERQAAILGLISRRRISRQAELVRLLREQGIEATQSSVSRDLKQLGVSKATDGYQAPATETSEASAALAAVAELVRRVEPAGPYQVVIGTAVGGAQRVAVFLDRSDWPEIVGTVSGDDTIFVATRNAGEQRTLISRLRQTLNNNE